jgi:hypothetical protein
VKVSEPPRAIYDSSDFTMYIFPHGVFDPIMHSQFTTVCIPVVRGMHRGCIISFRSPGIQMHIRIDRPDFSLDEL